ncbi:MAG: amidohydrolase family protein [Rhodothermales bacterium]
MLLLPPITRAQTPADEEVPEVTRTYALENARVVQAPGRVLDRATVVIRDGLIYAVGPDAAVPFDAERIAADSLTIYAGFIDGMSHAGVPKPKEEQNQQRPKNPGHPPNDRAGIQPDRDVRTLLDPTEKSLEALRKAGFTAAHVVPHGRMLPGSGAVVLLAGDDANDLVFKGDVSLFAQFETARRMYPGTDMAIMAKMRQLYREAERRQLMEKLYAEDPTGLERPDYDPAHYAFFPVLDGEKQVYFHTESALDLYRALDVQKALGFPLVLTGLSQSFDALDALKEANVPLFLTLDLPKAPKKDDNGKEKDAPTDSTAAPSTDAPSDLPEAQPSPYDPTFRAYSHEDLEAEKKNLEARQEMERAKYYGTAASLHEAGLNFGFSTMDAKPDDAMKNLRTMIENGLSEEVALAALTTNPADILGVSASMGTVEEGKMGNLVVTTGPIFAEDTKIRYVFVDGQKFEMETKKKATPSDPDAVVNPVGTWSYTVSTPDGDVEGTLTITGSPGSLSGTISSPMGPEPIDLDDVELDGNLLTFSFNAGPMGTISAEVTITDDAIEGMVSGSDFGGLEITGTRTSGPNF